MAQRESLREGVLRDEDHLRGLGDGRDCEQPRDAARHRRVPRRGRVPQTGIHRHRQREEVKESIALSSPHLDKEFSSHTKGRTFCFFLYIFTYSIPLWLKLGVSLSSRAKHFIHI